MAKDKIVHDRQNEEEKALNFRRYGLILAFLVILILSGFFFYVDCIPIGVVLVIVAALQILLFFTAPKYYVFSKDSLLIKYPFGLEENIQWQYVRSIINELEEPGRFFYLDSYKLYYYSKEKPPFFMQGIVSKNKKTVQLMKKYCPKNSQL